MGKHEAGPDRPAFSIDATDTSSQADFATWEEELAAPSAETQELSRSNFGDRIRNAADRVGSILDDRAEGKADRQEARAEKVLVAKEVVRSFGHGALEAAKKGWARTKSGAETAATFSLISKDTVIRKARKAQVGFAERQAYRENDMRTVEAQDASYDSYAENITYTDSHQEALEVNGQKQSDQEHAHDSYAENSQYSQAHEDALETNDQKVASQTEAYDSYAENIDAADLRQAWEQAKAERMDEIHGEALDENAKFDVDEARKNVVLLARAARYAKARRRNARREKLNAARDTTTEVWQKASKMTRRFGRAITTFAHKGSMAVTAGARAAKASYQESEA